MAKKESLLRSALNDLLSQTENEVCDQDLYQSQVDALIDDFDFKLLDGLYSKNEDSPITKQPSNKESELFKNTELKIEAVP